MYIYHINFRYIKSYNLYMKVGILIILFFMLVMTLPISLGQSTNQQFKIISASDFGCSPLAQDNIKQIIEKSPNLFLVPGDLGYDNHGACWFKEDGPLDVITKIAIGNHDSAEEQSKTLEKIYENHYNLKNPFYSFNMKDVHVLVLDTELQPSIKNDEQYKFAVDDLKTSSTNSKIDWTIVMFHKPIYTSKSEHPPELKFRSLYHPIFDEYGVDLVIQGHNHIYERTYPIKYNPSNSDNPLISKTNFQNLKNDNSFKNTFPTFVTVGMGGRSHYEILDHPQYIAKQDNSHFGFLDINVNKSQLKLIYFGTGINEKPKVLDEFVLQKSHV